MIFDLLIALIVDDDACIDRGPLYKHHHHIVQTVFCRMLGMSPAKKARWLRVRET